MPKWSATLRKSLSSSSADGKSASTSSNSTRMKNRSTTGSRCCAASLIVAPRWNKKSLTARTMPLASGHETVSTYLLGLSVVMGSCLVCMACVSYRECCHGGHNNGARHNTIFHVGNNSDPTCRGVTTHTPDAGDVLRSSQHVMIDDANRMARKYSQPMVYPSGLCLMLERNHMKYLHTMVRVSNLDESLDFYCNKLGLQEVERREHEQGRFTLVFLAAPGDEQA